MLHCPYCGKEVIHGDNYCHSCRRTLVDPLIDPSQKSQIVQSYERIRNPWIAAFLSLIGLGLGQFYNGETIKGLIFTAIFFIIPFFLNAYTSFNSFIFIIVFWGIIVIDAYYSSKKINELTKSFHGKSIFFSIEIIIILALLLVAIIFPGFIGNKESLFFTKSQSPPPIKENQDYINFTQEDLEKGARIKEQPYILRGKNRHVQFTLFEGVNDYLTINKPKYSDPNNELFWKELINDKVQQKYLTGFIGQIRKKTEYRDDQARIAISIAQQIYYDTNLEARVEENGYYYPYQTIFKDSGACADKSFLLAYTLKELGYGVALMKFDPERHVVVGIKAPAQYTYKNTGYAFIDPVCGCMIPTYDKGEYGTDPENLKPLTSTPIVIKISDGVSFDSIGEEYQDAAVFDQLTQIAQKNGLQLPHDDYEYKWQPLIQKYGCNQVYPKNVC